MSNKISDFLRVRNTIRVTYFSRDNIHESKYLRYYILCYRRNSLCWRRSYWPAWLDATTTTRFCGCRSCFTKLRGRVICRPTTASRGGATPRPQTKDKTAKICLEDITTVIIIRVTITTVHKNAAIVIRTDNFCFYICISRVLLSTSLFPFVGRRWAIKRGVSGVEENLALLKKSFFFFGVRELLRVTNHESRDNIIWKSHSKFKLLRLHWSRGVKKSGRFSYRGSSSLFGRDNGNGHVEFQRRDKLFLYFVDSE